MKGKEHAVQLSQEELDAYRDAVQVGGQPDILYEGGGGPNQALELMWKLRREHGFTARWDTEIDESGTMRYFFPK